MSFCGKPGLSLQKGRSSFRIRLVHFVNEEPPFFKSELMGSPVYAKNLKKRASSFLACFISKRCDYSIAMRNTASGIRHRWAFFTRVRATLLPSLVSRHRVR